jgi:hypothetical protein
MPRLEFLRNVASQRLSFLVRPFSPWWISRWQAQAASSRRANLNACDESHANGRSGDELGTESDVMGEGDKLCSD